MNFVVGMVCVVIALGLTALLGFGLTALVMWGMDALDRRLPNECE